MTISRDEYLKKITAKMHNGLIKVITGIRRCGKSFLLFRIFKEYLLQKGVPADRIIEISLEEKQFHALKNPLKLSEYIEKRLPLDGGEAYVLIDEIQMSEKVLPDDVDLSRIAPEDRDEAYVTFYDVLNELRKKPGVDVYVTGSNSKTLSRDVSTNFRDRGCEIRVTPLRFREYWPASGCDERALALERYFLWGGMPYALSIDDDAERFQYLRGLFDKVYAKDICERYTVLRTDVLSGLVDVLASSTGSLTNPHKIANTLKSVRGLAVGDHTIQNYLGYFEDAFLFAKAARWDVKGRGYLDYPQKYYITDTGLRNARLNFRESGDEAHLMENVVFNELLSRGLNVDVGVLSLTHAAGGRTELRQHEIDFVVNRPNGKIYIQCAWSLDAPGKRDQELLPLRKCGDNFRKIMVANGYAPPKADSHGIVSVGLIPFLLDDGVLEHS